MIVQCRHLQATSEYCHVVVIVSWLAGMLQILRMASSLSTCWSIVIITGIMVFHLWFYCHQRHLHTTSPLLSQIPSMMFRLLAELTYNISDSFFLLCHSVIVDSLPLLSRFVLRIKAFILHFWCTLYSVSCCLIIMCFVTIYSRGLKHAGLKDIICSPQLLTLTSRNLLKTLSVEQPELVNVWTS